MGVTVHLQTQCNYHVIICLQFVMYRNCLYSEVGIANRWKLSYLKQIFEEKSTTDQDSTYEQC